MMPDKGLLIIYLLAGVASGAVFIDPSWPRQGRYGVAGIDLVMILVNLWMYRAATRDPDPEFPTSSFERFMNPVTATVSFAVGLIAGVSLCGK